MSSTEDQAGSTIVQPGSRVSSALEKVRHALGGHQVPPPRPPADGSEEDDDDEGMLRMSFMDHLEELRTRIIRSLIGIVVAGVVCLTFSQRLWDIVQEPAVSSLKALHVDPQLAMTTPIEAFSIIWFKLPLLCALFVASPWVLYQVWAFIAPGLYRRERRWAAPFILCSAGLFILGGLFAYFVIFRFGLTFLLGVGIASNLKQVVTITSYFDLFVNVILGVGLVFEMPILVFFLTLIRVLSPAFLIRNSRYVILAIFVIAAVVTPTPDVLNLMLFATPMCILFYVGVLASYLLVLHRENRKFPWTKVLGVAFAVLLLLSAGVWLAITKYGFKLVPHWPFLTH